MQELVLAVQDLDKKMRMEVDALYYATGGVLSIEGEDEKWRLVTFLSKLLWQPLDTKSNSSTTSKRRDI